MRHPFPLSYPAPAAPVHPNAAFQGHRRCQRAARRGTPVCVCNARGTCAFISPVRNPPRGVRAPPCGRESGLIIVNIFPSLSPLLSFPYYKASCSLLMRCIKMERLHLPPPLTLPSPPRYFFPLNFKAWNTLIRPPATDCPAIHIPQASDPQYPHCSRRGPRWGAGCG